MEFRNNFALETSFDGGVLEISINGGPFADFVVAGGSFIAGGYTDTIDTDFGNPLAGRPAWSGSSGGFILTRAMLPPAAAGQSVQLRWVAGYDDSVSPTGAGWRIDDLAIASRQFVCSQTCADVRITTSAALVRLNATTVRATITVSNTGTTSAQNAQLTQAKTRRGEWRAAAAAARDHSGRRIDQRDRDVHRRAAGRDRRCPSPARMTAARSAAHGASSCPDE